MGVCVCGAVGPGDGRRAALSGDGGGWFVDKLPPSVYTGTGDRVAASQTDDRPQAGPASHRL